MIVLDTHVWIWWVSSPELLSPPAAQAVSEAVAGQGIGLSSMSVWEVALLVAKQRLRLTLDIREWIRRSEALPFVRFLPVTNAIALHSVGFAQPMHADPADRIIAATACVHGATLVTCDERLRASQQVQTVW